MPARRTNGELLNFTPLAYYQMFCEGHHIDMEAYPYMKYDYDPSTKNMSLFVIFDIRNEMKLGHQTSTVIITYKSISSKSQHDVFVYAA